MDCSGQTGRSRRYLVFVRAGAQSLHPRLIREDPHRNWDCCVSWCSSARDEQIAEYSLPRNEQAFNKFDAFREFRQSLDPWPYRYALLLDDDLYLKPGELSRFFELCDAHQTYLSQPVLRWSTLTPLTALVRNPACLLRRVSFIETTAPCFSASALADLQHTFMWTCSTWGMDWAWGALLQGKHPLYAVDAVPMTRTQAECGGQAVLDRKLRSLGIDPAEELQLMRKFFPRFEGARTLAHGHVFRRSIPHSARTALLLLFEKLKVIVRLHERLRNGPGSRKSCSTATASVPIQRIPDPLPQALDGIAGLSVVQDLCNPTLPHSHSASGVQRTMTPAQASTSSRPAPYRR